MRVDVSGQAQDDLAGIAEDIARDDPMAAERWVARLEAAALSVGDNPRMRRVVPELRNQNIREVLVQGYRLVYLIEPRRILLLTVFHGSRRLRAKRFGASRA